ncbi:MAG TPA: calcium-binding protein, partial [Rhizobiales bacterium]|nr:calcium-binding protein [Hyphomicrobiales bacterium]
DDDTIHGGNLDDIINGDAGADVLIGDAGSDTIHGGTENDRIYGGSTNDFLFGDEDHDLLSGSGGDDQLNGGTGNDRLLGASGNDTFIFDAGSGADRIFNFEDNTDQINISSSFGFATPAEVIAATNASGVNAIINLGGGNTINIVNWLLGGVHTITDLQDDIVIF